MTELTFKGKDFVYNHQSSMPFLPLAPDPEKSIGDARLDGRLIALVCRQAQYTPAGRGGQGEALLTRMKAAPADANLKLCRYADQHQSCFDVFDGTQPWSKPVLLVRGGPGRSAP